MSYLKPKDLGLGLDPEELAQIPVIADVRAKISPWLWVTSIVGFGLALLNTGRINAMWKRYGHTVWKGLKKPR